MVGSSVYRTRPLPSYIVTTKATLLVGILHGFSKLFTCTIKIASPLGFDRLCKHSFLQKSPLREYFLSTFVSRFPPSLPLYAPATQATTFTKKHCFDKFALLASFAKENCRLLIIQPISGAIVLSARLLTPS